MNAALVRMDTAELKMAWEVKEGSPGVYDELELPQTRDMRFDPVTFIVIAVGVALVSKFVSDWWDKLKGGLVIDQRSTEPNIFRSRAVPANYVVVYPADGGEVRIDTKDTPKDAIQQLLEAVIAAALGSTSGVSNAAAKVVESSRITARRLQPV